MFLYRTDNLARTSSLKAQLCRFPEPRIRLKEQKAPWQNKSCRSLQLFVMSPDGMRWNFSVKIKKKKFEQPSLLSENSQGNVLLICRLSFYLIRPRVAGWGRQYNRPYVSTIS